MSETCLWVRDAEHRGQDPEPVRCRPGGYVNCRPCHDHFANVLAENARLRGAVEALADEWDCLAEVDRDATATTTHLLYRSHAGKIRAALASPAVRAVPRPISREGRPITTATRRWFRWLRARRVDGVEAVRWRNGFYTRNRTDLPYPTGERRAA